MITIISEHQRSRISLLSTISCAAFELAFFSLVFLYSAVLSFNSTSYLLFCEVLSNPFCKLVVLERECRKEEKPMSGPTPMFCASIPC